jgi:hypothetical protein
MSPRSSELTSALVSVIWNKTPSTASILRTTAMRANDALRLTVAGRAVRLNRVDPPARPTRTTASANGAQDGPERCRLITVGGHRLAR